MWKIIQEEFFKISPQDIWSIFESQKVIQAAIIKVNGDNMKAQPHSNVRGHAIELFKGVKWEPNFSPSQDDDNTPIEIFIDNELSQAIEHETDAIMAKLADEELFSNDDS
jgi:hypothetical protein